MGESNIDAYIADLGDWRADVVHMAVTTIREAAPEARGSIKWAQPVFESNGPFAYVRAFRSSVNVGFWRGAELDDPAGLLSGSGDRMKHVSLKAGQRIDANELTRWVRQAVALNAERGDPTKRAAGP